MCHNDDLIVNFYIEKWYNVCFSDRYFHNNNILMELTEIHKIGKYIPIGKIDAVRRSTIKEFSFNPQYLRLVLDVKLIPDNWINDKLAAPSIPIVQQQI